MPPRTILGVITEAQTAPYSGDDLVAAVHHLNAVASYGGIHAKCQAVHVLRGVINGISTAVFTLAFDLRHASYGPAVTDPVYAAAHSLGGVAREFELAQAAIAALMNTTIGDLASSGNQVPNHAELNGGN